MDIGFLEDKWNRDCLYPLLKRKEKSVKYYYIVFFTLIVRFGWRRKGFSFGQAGR
jgi:hypothetical protein